MAYVILLHEPDPQSADVVRVAIQRAVEKDKRFTCTISGAMFTPRSRHLEQGWALTLQRVRLVDAKEYCGNHPGECFISPFGNRPKMKAKYCEWDDWVQFHGIVNDVLDRLKVNANAWTNPMELLSEGKKFWIRKDNRRRVRFEWNEQYRGGIGQPLRVWNAGTADQFEGYEGERKFA